MFTVYVYFVCLLVMLVRFISDKQQTAARGLFMIVRCLCFSASPQRQTRSTVHIRTLQTGVSLVRSKKRSRWTTRIREAQAPGAVFTLSRSRTPPGPRRGRASHPGSRRRRPRPGRSPAEGSPPAGHREGGKRSAMKREHVRVAQSSSLSLRCFPVFLYVPWSCSFLHTLCYPRAETKCLQFSLCACHPCAWAMLIFSLCILPK